MNDLLDAPGQPDVSSTPVEPSPPPPPAQTPAQASPPAAGATGQDAPKASKISEQGQKNLKNWLGDFIEDRLPAKTKKEGETPEVIINPPPKPKPAAKAKKPAPPAPKTPTVEEIAAADGKSVAEAIRPAAPATPSAPEGPKLDDDDAYTFSVLEFMEKQDTSKKGIAERFRQAQIKGYEYQDKWEKENPGQEWDPESPEHAEFRKSVEVPVSDREFEDARVDMRAEKIATEKVKPALDAQKKAAQDQERSQKVAAAQPQINAACRGFPQYVLGLLGDEFKGIVDERGNINQDEVKKLFEKDPVYAHARISAAKALDAEAQHIYLLMEGLIDPQTTPGQDTHQNALFKLHSEINQFGYDMEQKLISQPPEDQLDAQGRPFKPMADYYQLPKAQQKHYWTLTPDLVIPMRAKHWATQVRKNITNEEAKYAKWAQARGVKYEPPVQPLNGGATPPPDENDAQANGKPHSPSTSSVPRMAARNSPSPANGQDALTRWALEP